MTEKEKAEQEKLEAQPAEKPKEQVAAKPVEKPAEKAAEKPEEKKAAKPEVPAAAKLEAGKAEAQEKKGKKISRMTLSEVEAQLKLAKEKMGAFQSAFARHLLARKSELSENLLKKK